MNFHFQKEEIRPVTRFYKNQPHRFLRKKIFFQKKIKFRI